MLKACCYFGVVAIAALFAVCESASAEGQTTRRRADARRGRGEAVHQPHRLARPCPHCGRQFRLPTGRTYYNGRYYGNLNNRFYGPQYGYF